MEARATREKRSTNADCRLHSFVANRVDLSAITGNTRYVEASALYSAFSTRRCVVMVLNLTMFFPSD